MALIDKLSAIGDAIREKTGTTDLIKLDEMPTLILSIKSGGTGGIPEDIFLITGDIRTRFTDGSWDYFLTTEPWKNMFRSENITQVRGAFNGITLTEIPFTLNFGGAAADPKTGIDINTMFFNAKKLTKLPELGTPFYPSASMDYWLSGVVKITEIPQSWIENFKPDAFYEKVGYIQLPMNCYSLKHIPEEFVKRFKGGVNTSSYQAVYQSIIRQNLALDEIRGIPIYGNFTSNVFGNGFGACYRLENIIFETNEDDSPIEIQWKNQTIDLTNYVGYCPTQAAILDKCVGFNKSDHVTLSSYRSTAEFEAGVASNPNWFTSELESGRYTRRSAINTINSLPNTSAYLAQVGGTNTIKLKKLSAAGRNDNGYSLGIEYLTPEEIAIATAKGWTVTLV